MSPDSLPPAQAPPASLPAMPPAAVPAPPQAGQQPAAPAPATPQPAPSGQLNPSEAAALQARQLVAQYADNPFALSEAMQRLKGQYLAEQFNITPNPVDQ